MKFKTAIVLAVLLMLIAATTAIVGIGEVTRQVEEAAVRVGSGMDGPYYVRMGNNVIPVIRRDNVTTHIDITIDLEVDRPENKEQVDDAMPRLRDAYIRDLATVALWPDANGEMRLPITSVKKRLLVISKRILVKGVVRDLLVKNVLERKL